jgi:hypothetical protein
MNPAGCAAAQDLAVTSPERALALAQRQIEQAFPDAEAAWIGGSLFSGCGTAHSDIDVVVLRPRVDAGSRQVFQAGRMPVEAFVHDDETLRWYLDTDRQRGRPALLRLVAEGRIVGARLDAAQRWQAWAKAAMAAGPAPSAITCAT